MLNVKVVVPMLAPLTPNLPAVCLPPQGDRAEMMAKFFPGWKNHTAANPNPARWMGTRKDLRVQPRAWITRASGYPRYPP